MICNPNKIFPPLALGHSVLSEQQKPKTRSNRHFLLAFKVSSTRQKSHLALLTGSRFLQLGSRRPEGEPTSTDLLSAQSIKRLSTELYT